MKGNKGETTVQTNIFDQEEIIEGCTVQILRNSVTGETSVGWWRGTAADMPRIGGRNAES